MKLYHTGAVEIREPDVFHGRKNADFGQGFYLTPDLDFSYRWARDEAVLNEYELDLEGLEVRRFERGEEWFRYIFHNRRAEDGLSADVVIGPIANDTIFETFGVISSGFLSAADAMKLLMIGPCYTQVAVKSERAAKQLRFLRSGKITKLDAERRREEQAAYDEDFAVCLQEIVGESSRGRTDTGCP